MANSYIWLYKKNPNPKRPKNIRKKLGNAQKWGQIKKDTIPEHNKYSFQMAQKVALF